MPPVTVVRGRVIVYRVFDIAEEFDLTAVERIEGTIRSRRWSVARSTGHSLIVKDAPLTLALGTGTVRIGRQRPEMEIFARLWHYGVVSVQFQLSLPSGTSWQQLVEIAAAAEDDNDFDEQSALRVRELATAIRPAARLPHEPRGVEDYVVYLLEQIDGVATPAELLQAVDVAALILGEPVEVISRRTREAILENTLSYSERDLAVIDWNSALLVEPDGSRDVADILEFALTHLLEFRYFDELLDFRLERLYDLIERRRTWLAFFRNDYQRLSHEASALYLELSEYVERVENSLKFVGDHYLATVFRAAVTRFNLREWEETVGRKMTALVRISELLQGEVNAQRSHWLEIIVVVLILVEIISTVVRLT
jgi:hypothetical protein